MIKSELSTGVIQGESMRTFHSGRALRVACRTQMKTATSFKNTSLSCFKFFTAVAALSFFSQLLASNPAKAQFFFGDRAIEQQQVAPAQQETVREPRRMRRASDYSSERVVKKTKVPKIEDRSEEDQRQKANSNIVSIVCGPLSGTFIQICSDLASVMDESADVRVLSVLSKGSLQNLRDIVLLRGVDLGLVQSDALEHLKTNSEIPGLDRKVTYISKLYNEEIHILARNDIKDFRDLQGKRVNVDRPGSGSQFTGKLLLSKFGINVNEVHVEQTRAYEMMKNGELDATIFITGKPSRGLVSFDNDGRFHFVTVPYDEKIQDLYLPATLTSAEYPNLVPANGKVDTIAISAVLAAYNWPVGSERYRRLARFVDAFFARFEEFQRPPRHPKWAEANLKAEVPGWQRFKAADDWLKSRPQVRNSAEEFASFLDDCQKKQGMIEACSSDKEQLFREFLKWQKNRLP